MNAVPSPRAVAALSIATLLILVAATPAASAAAGGSGASAPVVAGDSPGTDTSPTRIVDGVSIGQQTGTATPANATNATNTSHENPDEVDRDGDAAAVRSALASRLAERLSEGSVRIEQGEYEAARGALDDDYAELLSAYVEVAGDAADASPEAFERAGERQREYAEAAAEFEETYEAYREARRAGNESRARELARELREDGERVNRTGTNLTRSFDAVESTTAANLTDATSSVRNATASVENRTESAVEATFVRTVVEASVARESAAFDDPVGLSGRIATADGDPVANRTVTLVVGERRLRVATDETGAFETTYRPVGIRTGDRSVRVAYRPADDSVFLGANDTVALAVRPTNATVTITASPERAAAGDRIAVTGTVTANGTPVADAPVRVTVGGTTLGVVRTAENGSYRLAASLPASVTAGEATVTAGVDGGDRAVRAGPAEADVTVASTPVTIDANATAPNGSTAVVAGTVETENGDPVTRGAVEISVDGSVVATARLGDDGTFRRLIDLEDAVGEGDGGDGDRSDGSVAIAVSYADPATSLERASATIRVDRDAGDEATTAAIRSALSSVPVLPLGAVVATGIGLAVLIRRDRGTDPVAGAVGGDEATDGDRVGDDAAAGDRSPGRDLLAAARRRHEAGEERAAVETAYRAARRAVAAGEGVSVPATGTHWEVNAAAGRALPAAAADRFERITERYERVAYGDEQASPSAVADLLEDCEALVNAGDADRASDDE
ncbi:hypothetical protein Hbl1158_14645 [Halobaculum sp. CBA1158]|uniref:DUF4129 domain-containing protein n=1 Tax=Halobaculum sp. CBA1158 TaxID=2904243 RepID=UPI001F21BE92|nr:DUF4129 domain-containing protein [Halobaculum sp. CBA1158]UIO99740.1 hypothetical protein Hbl1158_14645 [Halobaculum sp. CBA1158]